MRDEQAKKKGPAEVHLLPSPSGGKNECSTRKFSNSVIGCKRITQFFFRRGHFVVSRLIARAGHVSSPCGAFTAAAVSAQTTGTPARNVLRLAVPGTNDGPGGRNPANTKSQDLNPE